MSRTPEIQMIDGEPRISDVALAAQLGISMAKVRALIEKHRDEVEKHGPLVCMPAREADARSKRDLRAMLLGRAAGRP